MTRQVPHPMVRYTSPAFLFASNIVPPLWIGRVAHVPARIVRVKGGGFPWRPVDLPYGYDRGILPAGARDMPGNAAVMPVHAAALLPHVTTRQLMFLGRYGFLPGMNRPSWPRLRMRALSAEVVTQDGFIPSTTVRQVVDRVPGPECPLPLTVGAEAPIVTSGDRMVMNALRAAGCLRWSDGELLEIMRQARDALVEAWHFLWSVPAVDGKGSVVTLHTLQAMHPALDRIMNGLPLCVVRTLSGMLPIEVCGWLSWSCLNAHRQPLQYAPPALEEKKAVGAA